MFGSILDRDDGGFYALRPSASEWSSRQLYFPTRWLGGAVLRGDRPTGELLGNFPRAFTHIALISGACNLDRARG